MTDATRGGCYNEVRIPKDSIIGDIDGNTPCTTAIGPQKKIITIDKSKMVSYDSRKEYITLTTNDTEHLTQETIDAIEKQQVLGLALILFQLFNNLDKKAAHILFPQLAWNAERENLRRKSELAIPQDYEPFSSFLLLKAYNERLTLEQLKKEIDSLK